MEREGGRERQRQTEGKSTVNPEIGLTLDFIQGLKSRDAYFIREIGNSDNTFLIFFYKETLSSKADGFPLLSTRVQGDPSN